MIAFKQSLMFFLNFRRFYFKKGNHVCLKENAVPIWHFFSTVPKCLGAELSFSTGAEMSWCRTVLFPSVYIPTLEQVYWQFCHNYTKLKSVINAESKRREKKDKCVGLLWYMYYCWMHDIKNNNSILAVN